MYIPVFRSVRLALYFTKSFYPAFWILKITMTNSNQNDSLLRFMTCGSVDDGKSTLIGRLLFDTKTILADTLMQMERTSGNAAMK